MANISILSNLKSEIFSNDDRISDLRLVGQEENGLLLFAWVFDEDLQLVQLIGSYDRLNKNLEVLQKLKHSKNSTVIQATTNFTKSCLVYVVKSSINEEENQTVVANHCKYEAFVCSVSKECECTRSLVVKENHQIMAQFLSRRKHNQQEKILLFIHQECKCSKEFEKMLENFKHCLTGVGNLQYSKPTSCVGLITWVDRFNQF